MMLVGLPRESKGPAIPGAGTPFDKKLAVVRVITGLTTQAMQGQRKSSIVTVTLVEDGRASVAPGRLSTLIRPQRSKIAFLGRPELAPRF